MTITRNEAIEQVKARWDRLGLDRNAAPIMFSLDVQNALSGLYGTVPVYDGLTIERLIDTTEAIVLRSMADEIAGQQ